MRKAQELEQRRIEADIKQNRKLEKKKQDDDFFTSMSKSFTTNFDAMQKSMNTMFNPTEKKKKSPEKDYVEDLPVQKPKPVHFSDILDQEGAIEEYKFGMAMTLSQ